MKRIVHPLTAIALTFVLGACATPQTALDQANATAALATSFDGELSAYRRAAARVAAARLASIRRQEALMAQLAEIDDWNLHTARLAGLGEIEDRRRSLISLAESRELGEAATKKRLAELDTRLAAVVTPLPSTSSKLAALKTALAEMGAELPAAERLKLALDAVDTVRDEVKKNRDAANQAESKARTATVPPSPAPPQETQP